MNLSSLVTLFILFDLLRSKVPAFSIIIPVYNRVSFLKKSINSILNQTFTDFEILLINDHSEKNIQVKIEELADLSEKIKLINKPKNEGVSMARNTGIDHAHGEYVIFQDDDDTLFPDMLGKMYSVFSQNPEIDIAACKGTVIDGGNLWNEKYFLRKELVEQSNGHLHWLGSDKRSLFFLLYFPLVNAFVYRSAVLQQYRFAQELPVSSGEDTYFWFLLSKQDYVFKVCDWMGARYRLHELESTTSVQTLNHRLLFWRTVDKIVSTRQEALTVKKAIAGLLLKKKEISIFRYLSIVLRFPLFYFRLIKIVFVGRLVAKLKYYSYKWRRAF